MLTTFALLTQINTIRKLKKNPQNTDHEILTNELVAVVEKDYGTNARIYLTEALIALDFTQVRENTFEDLYQRLLPVCRLAYVLEENGVPENHAFKLATIFNKLAITKLDDKKLKLALADNYNSAFNYLLTFKNFNKCSYLVHDACLFDLPPANSRNFEQWKRLAKTHLSNPHFRTLLPHADVIENIGNPKGKTKLFNEKEKRKIKEKKKELTGVAQEYKTLHQKPLTDPTEDHKRERADKLKQLNIKKSTLRIELANLTVGLPLADADLMVLKSWYEYYKQGSNLGHQILIDNGLTEKSIIEFNTLKRDNDDNIIPNVFIDGQAIGYPDYYIKKLDTLSDKGAALAACLGKITHCCQYLGGAGSTCAIHGIGSPYGGFYVLCERKSESPSLDDPILAVAWIWQGKGNGLCLDSVEAAIDTENNLLKAIDLFRFLGHTLCQQGINQVNVGAQSGISSKVGLNNYPTQKEHFKDYAGYCDSKSQLSLGKANMPYLFYGKVNSSELQNLIAKDTQDFFNKLFTDQKELTENEPLKQAIAFALYNQDRDDLLTLLRKVATDKNSLETLIKVNQDYLNALNENNIRFDLIKRGAYLDAINKKGKSALHLAAMSGNIATVEELILLKVNLNIQDKYGNTALFNTLEKLVYEDKKEQGREIIKRLIEAGAEIDIKDKNENTALLLAVKNNDLSMVRYLVEKGADLETFDIAGNTVLHLIIEKMKRNTRVSFKNNKNKNELLHELVKDLIAAGIKINTKNNSGNTPLILSAKNGHSSVMRDLVEHKADIEITDNDMRTALFWAAKQGDEVSVDYLLEQKANVNVRDKDEMTLLMVTLENKHYSIAKKIFSYGTTLINHQDKRGFTALHFLIKNLDKNKEKEWEFALRLIEAGAHLDIKEGVLGNTVLHIIPNLELLNVFLPHVPKEKWLEALTCPNELDDSVLHIFANFPNALKTILSSLSSREEQLEAVKSKDKNEVTILHKACLHPESAVCVLELYPESQRLKELTTLGESKMTVLDYMLQNNPKSFSHILRLIPETKRLDFLRIKIDKTHIIDEIIANPPNPPIEHSFVEHYISLQRILRKKTFNPYSFSISKDPAWSTLSEKIKQAETFEDIKNVVLNYIVDDQNPNTEITKIARSFQATDSLDEQNASLAKGI